MAVDPTVWRAAAVIRRDNAIAAIDAEVVQMNTAITALQAGGAAWDNATPAQRTSMMLNVAQDLKALMLDHKRVLNELLDSP